MYRQLLLAAVAALMFVLVPLEGAEGAVVPRVYSPDVTTESPDAGEELESANTTYVLLDLSFQISTYNNNNNNNSNNCSHIVSANKRTVELLSRPQWRDFRHDIEKPRFIFTTVFR